MSALGASLVTAVVTAALAVVGTYVTTRRNLQVTFDTSLRDLRLEAYRKLWKDLEPLAKYARPETLTRGEARKLAGALRTWYFETGGIVLSHRTRQDYFALLDGLENLTAGVGPKRLGAADDEFLRVLGSRLRTGMTVDVGTRRSFPFQETGSAAVEPNQRSYAEEGGRRRLVVKRGWRRWLVFGPRQPSLGGDGVPGKPRWHAERQAFTARASAGGAVDEREYLVEAGEVVEGPKGWQRGATAPRGRGAVWRERRPDA
jgi:hypothetical protein